MNCTHHSRGPRDQPIKRRVSIPVYLDTHPIRDYEPVGRVGQTWVGSHRDRSSRQMAMVHQLHLTNLADFRGLSRASHPNVAHPIALYVVGHEPHLAYEYVELDIFDLHSPSALEVAAIMAQV